MTTTGKKASAKSGSHSKGAADDANDFATVTVSEEVLLETPKRVLKFVTAVNRSLVIRAALERRGMTPAVRAAGWKLLRECSGAAPEHEEEADLDVAVRDATTQVDDSDEDLVGTIKASLEHTFPEQAKFLLKDIAAVKGPGAVFVVETLLERLDVLEHGKDREHTRAKDHGALARLAQRGIDPARREALATLVKTAKGPDKPVTADPEATAEAESAAQDDHAEYLRALRALRAWYEEWSGIAKLAIKRRDHLVRLGLAQQKKPGKKGKKNGTQPGDPDAEGTGRGAP